jgi:uncharacterized Zn finger protein (UPF0148 family)
MYCENCGGPLDCYKGEWYCPPCTYFTTTLLAAAAADEAHRERQAPAGADDGPPEDNCPW